MVFFISPVLQRLGLGMSWEHTLTVWIAALSGSFNIIMAMMASQDLTSVIGKESGQTVAVSLSMHLSFPFVLSFVRSIVRSFVRWLVGLV